MDKGNANVDAYRKFPKYFKTMVYVMTLTGMWRSASDHRINKINFTVFVGLNCFGFLGSVAVLYDSEVYDEYRLFESLIFIPLFTIASVGAIIMAKRNYLIDKILFDVVETGYTEFDDSSCEKSKLARTESDDESQFLIKCVSWVIAADHFMKIISSGAWNPFSENKTDFIPLSIHFYKSDSVIFYYLMYFLEFFSSAACGTLNVLSITICAGLVNIISSEVDALKYAFEDPTHLQLLSPDKEQNDENKPNQDHELNEMQYYERLKLQVHQHIKIIRCKDDTELLIGPVAFNMFVISEFIVCFCIFQIFQLTSSFDVPNLPVIFNRIAHFAALMVQQFVFFVAGQRIESKSAELHKYLYFCPWYKRYPRYNSSLRIMFERARKPLILKAGYLIPINLKSFVGCMQATFSYFNLLRAMSKMSS